MVLLIHRRGVASRIRYGEYDLSIKEIVWSRFVRDTVDCFLMQEVLLQGDTFPVSFSLSLG